MVACLAEPLGKLIEELKLVSEFLVDLGIRQITAGRYVKVVDQDRHIAGDPDGNMPRVTLAAELTLRYLVKRYPENDSHTMITGLAMVGDVDKPCLAKDGRGKLARRTFCFLKAEDVDVLLLQQPYRQFGAKPYRIDVPSRYSQSHGPAHQLASISLNFLAKSRPKKSGAQSGAGRPARSALVRREGKPTRTSCRRLYERGQSAARVTACTAR